MPGSVLCFSSPDAPIDQLTRIMTTITHEPAIRISPENRNHHLWNNNGTWFLHYTIHPTPFTKERIRRSLGTKDIETARQRRDSIFGALGADATRAA